MGEPGDERTEARPSGPGALFDGRYRVISEIGRGGFGAVQLVEDTLRGGRRLALKSILPELASTREFEQRFHREIDVLRSLAHPSIPAIVNDGRAPDGTFYFTMEYVEGEALSALVKRDGPVDPARLARITRQLCSALDHAHGAGIVHRDLKPSNVLVSGAGTDDERVHVLDFGIAKLLEPTGSDVDVTMQTSGFIGTPEYASPEQVLGEEVDARSDTYSLGILIYHLATGRFPFKGTSRQEVATKRLHTPPTPLGRDEAPREIRALVKALLHREREGRPAPAEISRVLDRMLDELGTERAHGRRLTLILGGLLGIALLVIGGARLWPRDHEPAAPESSGAPSTASAEDMVRSPAPEPAEQVTAEDLAATPDSEGPDVAVHDDEVPAGVGSEDAGPATDTKNKAEDTPPVTTPDPVVVAPPPAPAPIPPAIALSAPEQGLSVAPGVATIEVAGEVTGDFDPSSSALTVASSEVALAGAKFAAQVPLDFGLNRIPVELRSSDGVLSEQMLVVTRRAPRLPDGCRAAAGADFIGELPTRIETGRPAIPLVLVTGADGGPLVYLGETEVTASQYGRGTSPPTAGADLPVVNVSAEDARVFAFSVGGRLPTVEEWLAGALDPRLAPPAEEQLFPWRGAFDAERANSREAGVGALVPALDPAYVPAGESWCGLAHMAGNAAEWATADGEPVALGGSFQSRADRCRSAPRTPSGRTGARPDTGLRLAIDLPPTAPSDTR